MPIKANSAFAGAHRLGGISIEVAHLNAARVAEFFPNNPPPGHPRRRKTGWYWTAGDWHGPFTSSRKAFKDAQAKAKDQ